MKFAQNTSLLSDSQDLETAEEQRSHYQRLMRVRILHDFCNDRDCRCPDFVCAPTATTATFMASLGLLFRDEVDGFSVLYKVKPGEKKVNPDKRDLNYLIEYLQNSCKVDPDAFWARLSFVLSLRNAFFFNCTYTGQTFIKVSPVTKNFYFSNRRAHRTRDSIMLGHGPFVREDDLQDVAPDQRKITIDPLADTTFIAVTDISSEIVQCHPVYVPTEMPGGRVDCQSLAQWVNADPERVKKFPEWKATPADLQKLVPVAIETIKPPPPNDKSWTRQTSLFVDFYKLPRGRYDVLHLSAEGTSAKETLLYTFPSGSPLCFIDLLLTDPTPDKKSSGVYPVRHLTAVPPGAPHPKVHSTQYTLHFQARKTYWIYYIVPTLQEDSFEGLCIVSLAPKWSASFVREPAGKVTLNNGQKAYRFRSTTPIHLFEQSPFHFSLQACGDAAAKRVLMDPLPVASDKQTFPNDPNFALPRAPADKGNQGKIFSNIYVYV